MKRLLAAFAASCTAAACFAAVPIRTEQLVWSIIAPAGGDYTATFAPEGSSTLYLVAGADNILSARKTLLYWWPITEDWKADTESLNVLFPGSLEVRDSAGRLHAFPLSQYTYFNVRGEYEKNWKILTGYAAGAEVTRYGALFQEYFAAAEKYKNDTVAFEAEFQRLMTQVQRLKDEGKDFAAPLSRMQGLSRPQAPPPPAYYVVPPSELQDGFVVNLPAGRYTLRLRNPDGTIMEGSERAVVVDGPRRRNGIGYEVIPADKWTRPVASTTPSSVIYVNGAADLYVRPYFQDEYNDLFYEKTLNNQARANPTVSKWVRIQQVPRAAVEYAPRGSPAVALAEEQYYVEQSTGSSLGYSIIPWDPAGPYKDQGPSLVAFRVPLEPRTGGARLRVLDKEGAALGGGDREIRVVAPLPAWPIFIVLALLPLVPMFVLLAGRSRLYRGEGSTHQVESTASEDAVRGRR